MRSKTTKNGNVYYYYDTCAKPRKWLALGCDYLDALKKYADYEREFSDGLLARTINALIHRSNTPLFHSRLAAESG